MMMNRRVFAGSLVTGGVAVASGVALEGCNSAQWMQVALNDLPTVLQIAMSIISIVAAAKGQAPDSAIGEAQKLAQEVQQGIQTVQTLMQQYQSSPTNDLLSKIDAALMDAQKNLSAILTVLHINNSTLQATIAAAVGSALTVVVAIQALVPPPPNPAPAPQSSQRAALHSTNSNAAAIRLAFNEAVTAAGGAQYAVR